MFFLEQRCSFDVGQELSLLGDWYVALCQSVPYIRSRQPRYWARCWMLSCHWYTSNINTKHKLCVVMTSTYSNHFLNQLWYTWVLYRFSFSCVDHIRSIEDASSTKCPGSLSSVCIHMLPSSTGLSSANWQCVQLHVCCFAVFL